jgi:hypothetical protein
VRFVGATLIARPRQVDHLARRLHGFLLLLGLLLLHLFFLAFEIGEDLASGVFIYSAHRDWFSPSCGLPPLGLDLRLPRCPEVEQNTHDESSLDVNEHGQRYPSNDGCAFPARCSIRAGHRSYRLLSIGSSTLF